MNLPIISDNKKINKLPYNNEFIEYVLKKYLFDNIPVGQIEKEYFDYELYGTGAPVVNVLEYFGLISDNGTFDNSGIYQGQDIYTIGNYLINQMNENYRLIGEYLLPNINKEKDFLTLYKEYYLSNIENLIRENDSPDINGRNDFINTFPLEKLSNLKIEDYCLGLENPNSFCYQVEHGKYKEIGAPCDKDPNGAAHWGIYYSKTKNCYLDNYNNPIENVQEYWKKFIKQLQDFLTSLANENISGFSTEYPLLKNMTKTLAKLCYLYYPEKFINILTKSNLIPIMDYLKLPYEYSIPAEELSYKINEYLRKNIQELNDNDPEYIGNTLWKFINEIYGKNKTNETETIDDNLRVKGAYNMIYYGTPGCGKSHTVNEKYCKNDNIVIRTTFHPEYSNSDFIGQIIPKLEGEKIYYGIQEGPFAKALLSALENQTKEVYLIIEEINRGNASAIFGDIFQLLDRDEDGDGSSIYFINNYLLEKYLAEHGRKTDKITIPSNLWIIATMNTSDQNVFTLDNAFKRRWRMNRIANKFNKNNHLANMVVPKTRCTWENFVKTINQAILDKNPIGINSEDKQLGVYFVSKRELIDETTENEEEIAEFFAEKVLMYLWNDIAKINPSEWFGPECKSFDNLLDEFNKKGLKVFKDLDFPTIEIPDITIIENNEELH